MITLYLDELNVVSGGAKCICISPTSCSIDKMCSGCSECCTELSRKVDKTGTYVDGHFTANIDWIGDNDKQKCGEVCCNERGTSGWLWGAGGLKGKCF